MVNSYKLKDFVSMVLTLFDYRILELEFKLEVSFCTYCNK